MTPQLRARLLDLVAGLRATADRLEHVANDEEPLRSDHTERDLAKAVEYLNRDG